MPSRVAIVTGAGRGLGSAIATTLASQGVDVVLSGRTESHLKGIEQEIRDRGAPRSPCRRM